MKALTLTQPWATLVAIGAKRIETRSWYTAYRGPLAIHAAKGFPKWARQFTTEAVVYEAVKAQYCQRDIDNRAKGFPAYPLGVVLATCRLVYCVPTERVAAAACPFRDLLTVQEREFGDYEEGRFAWILDNMQALAEPIPAKGALGLWDWEPPAALRVREPEAR
jgi:hypothetical protein